MEEKGEVTREALEGVVGGVFGVRVKRASEDSHVSQGSVLV